MKLQVLLAASCIAASLQAHASNPLEPVELSDAELAQLRGRYVMPGQIVSFGVTMSSMWENSSGQVLGGQVNMQINESMFQPQFTVTTIATDGGTSAPTAGTGQVTGGSGLSDVAGVSQSVRAAGDFNTVFNGVTMNVSKDSSSSSSLEGGSSTLSAVTGSSNAGSVQINTINGGFQILIDAVGQGSSLQQLANQGLQQATVVTGSGNTVNSVTTLDVILRDSGMGTGQLANGWSQVGALRPTGF